MAINLAALLQGVPGLDQAPPPRQNWEEVVGAPVPVATPGYGGPAEPVASTVSQDIQGTEDIGAKALEKFQHKGLFGVKGTLRDILGVLGDGFTNGRIGYADQRRREKYGDILAGGYQDNEEENFVNNPLLTIQRLGEAGYGQEATALYEQMQKEQAAKQAALLNEARLSRQENRDDVLAASAEAKRQKDIQDIAARTYGGIQDEETLRQFNERFAPVLEKNGLGYIPLPKNLTEAKGWGIDTYRSNVLEDKDMDRGQRGDIASQRIGATIRGQDVSAATSRRGQDIRSEDTRRGQDLRGKKTVKPSSPTAAIPSMIPPAPRKANDRIVSPDGTRYVSPDGKRWVKAN